MKKTKLSLVLIVVMVMTLLITACGNSDKTEDTKDNGKISSETSSEIDWPEKAIEIVIPFSAGGDTDFNARTMAKYLEKELGQPFAVTNVTGSGGTIASAQVKDSKNDGSKLLISHVAVNIAQAAGVADYGYEDFEMGPIIARSVGDVILVRGDSPWDSIEDMIKDTKSNPGKYKIAANTGATTHWVAIGLQNAGAEFNVVDSGSASDRVPALLGGHVDVICNSLSSVKDYVESGDFKVLAIANAERNQDFPDIPTLKENGVDVEFECSYTSMFPKGTDPQIIEKFSKTVEDIVNNNAEYQEEIYKAYEQRPFYLNPKETTEYYKDEYNRLLEISDKLKGN